MKALRLLLLGCLLWVTLAAWALSSPVYSSPDDNYHLPMLYCAAGEAECSPDGERVDVCYAFNGDQPADCLTTAGDPVPPTEAIRSGWYPPVYYAVGSLFVGSTLAETTATLRLVNSAIVVAVLLGSVVLTRRSLRPAVVMSWLVCSFPLAAFLFASVNPHAWTIAGLAALWGPLLSFLTSASKARSPREAFRPDDRPWLPLTQLIFVQICAVMALGSRTESPIFLVVIIAAVSVFALRWPLTRTTRGAVVALAVPAILALEAVVTFALMASSRFAQEAAPPQDAVYSTWTLVLAMFQLPLRAVVDPELGWFDTPMPLIVQALAAGAFFAALLIGLRVLYRKKVVALGVFGLGSLAVLFYVLVNASSLYRYQPRYFLPLLFVLIGLASLPLVGRAVSRRGIPTRLQWVGIIVAVVVVNSLSLLNNTTRYVLGIPENPRSVIEAGDRNNVDPTSLFNADVPVWWWNSLPFTPWQVWVIGSVAFAAAALLLLSWLLIDPRRADHGKNPAAQNPVDSPSAPQASEPDPTHGAASARGIEVPAQPSGPPSR